MSVFSHLMSDASDALVDALGELATITYKPPVGKVVELVGVMVGAMDVETVVDESSGTVAKRETITIRIPRHTNDLPKQVYQHAKFTIRSLDDRSWVPQPQGSSAGETFIDYKLERKLLANMDKHQNAAV